MIQHDHSVYQTLKSIRGELIMVLNLTGGTEPWKLHQCIGKKRYDADFSQTT